MRRLCLILPACAALAACGPSMTQVRKYVVRSPHRSVVLFPLDYRGGQRNASSIAGSAVDDKLRRDGFQLADKGKTQNVYNASVLKNGAFGAVVDAAALARALGAKAAVVGAVDDAYERLERRPATYEWISVAPPACCFDSAHPCAHTPVFDPSVNHYVDRCEGIHQKVQTQPAVNDRYAGLTLRLRFIDAASGRILWESGYTGTLHQATLWQVADQVSDVLNDQLAEAMMQQKF